MTEKNTKAVRCHLGIVLLPGLCEALVQASE